MKLTIRLLLFFAIILFPFIATELGLRFMDIVDFQMAPGNESGVGYQAKAMKKFVQLKINRLWMRTSDQRASMFEPPFPVFVNVDFHSSERIGLIAERSPLPPNLNITTENFLRLNPKSQNETFTVSTNSFGFRGHERNLEKSKNTFRIILLGSYPAFGHAVNDDQTYASILENELNRYFKGKKKFEVWNGGKVF